MLQLFLYAVNLDNIRAALAIAFRVGEWCREILSYVTIVKMLRETTACIEISIVNQVASRFFRHIITGLIRHNLGGPICIYDGYKTFAIVYLNVVALLENAPN